MAVPYELTVDGFEIQLQVNYIAHWLLAYHLLPTLLSTARATGPGGVRIVCVSSEGHQTGGFTPGRMHYDLKAVEGLGNYGRYAHSKIANVMHAKTLNTQYGPDSKSARDGRGEIWTASLHPGFIASQLNEKNRDSAGWKLSWIHPVLLLFGIMRPWDEGCIASLFAGASPDFTASMSGVYLTEKAVEKKCHPVTMKEEARDELEQWTVQEMKSGGWI